METMAVPSTYNQIKMTYVGQRIYEDRIISIGILCGLCDELNREGHTFRIVGQPGIRGVTQVDDEGPDLKVNEVLGTSGEVRTILEAGI
jgi:hypothetical protein